jgi:protein-disulfide isomerase
MLKRVAAIATNIATGVMVICVVWIAGMSVRRELWPRRAEASHPAPIQISNWPRLLDGGHRIGPASAPVTIVVFTDFECPFCRAFVSGTMPAIVKSYPGQVSFAIRHFPLPTHRFAYPAARAAECAANQRSFDAFHETLFLTQDSLGLIPFRELARRVGVPDLDAFERCNAIGGTVPIIEADINLAREIKVNGTPTVIVNGWLVQPDSASVDSLVKSFLVRSGG